MLAVVVLVVVVVVLLVRKRQSVMATVVVSCHILSFVKLRVGTINCVVSILRKWQIALSVHKIKIF